MKNSTAVAIGYSLGIFFGMYFLIYPILFYVWNWFIVQIGYEAFKIPGFWIGMAGFFVFNVIRTLLFGAHKI